MKQRWMVDSYDCFSDCNDEELFFYDGKDERTCQEDLEGVEGCEKVLEGEKDEQEGTELGEELFSEPA